MFVKVCQVTNVEDALYAASLGVDAIGFIFARSPRQVTAEDVAPIVRRLPDHVLTVAAFRHQDTTTIVEAVKASGVRAVQLSGDETPDDAAAVRPHVEFLIKAFAGGDPAVRTAADYGADAVMLDGARPGSGHTFDWSLAADVPPGQKLLLAGGLTAENVSDAIAATHPWGVDVGSSVERRPGVKDHDRVRAFVEAVRSATQQPAPAGP